MGQSSDNRETEQRPETTMQERVIERIRQMTSDERFALMVAAGIYTPDGKLTPKYCG